MSTSADTPTTIAEGRAKHAEAARMNFDLARSQVRNATELGKHAWGMGIGHADNPFVGALANRTLFDAWASGWVLADIDGEVVESTT